MIYFVTKLTADELLAAVKNADWWEIVREFDFGGQTLLIKCRWRNGSIRVYQVPNPEDMSTDEYQVFAAKFNELIEGAKTDPRKLIGYKIGDKVYRPDDVTLVYEGDASGEPTTLPTSGESSQ